jgi:hypothetical protein
MIETTQKIIQIGSSNGVTLSKKDLARLGAKRGDEVLLKVELSKKNSQPELMRGYDKFVQIYGKTLKNLADR